MFVNLLQMIKFQANLISLIFLWRIFIWGCQSRDVRVEVIYTTLPTLPTQIKPTLHSPLQLCHHQFDMIVWVIQAKIFCILLKIISWLNVITLGNYILMFVILVLLVNILNFLSQSLITIVCCLLIFYKVMYGHLSS